MSTFGKVIFSEGVYIGEVLNGKAHGYGRINFNNGDKYIGQWSNNAMTGVGFMYSNKMYTLGNFINGKKHGRCLTIIQRGSYQYDFFIGSYLNNLKHGSGAYLWESEDCYVGEFANDVRNGKGVYSGFGCKEFYGAFYQDDKFVRQTTIYPKTELPDGHTFFGDCNRHYFYSGYGLLVSPQQKRREIGYHNKLGPNLKISYNFKGVVVGGNKIRVGALSKFLAVGDWGESTIKLNGYFEKIYENGNMYFGNYSDGKKDGYGVFYDGNFTSNGLGSIYIGTFRNGKFVDGVEVSSSFLILAKGKFTSSTSDGFKLYDTGELMTFNYNGSKNSKMIGFEPYDGILNSSSSTYNNRQTAINNNSNNYEYNSNSNNYEDDEEDPPIIDFYKAEEMRKYLEKVREEAKIREKEKKERLERERKEKEAQLAKEKKRREIEEKIKQVEIEKLKEKYYLNKELTEVVRCTHNIEEKYHMIPEGIKKLGRKSFVKQNKVEKIVGSTTINTIEELAFAYSPSIKEIDLSVTSINGLGGKCFVDCVNLETLWLPDTIKEVSIDNFHNCNKLNKIIFPSKEMSFKEFVDMYCSDKDKKFSKYHYFDETEHYKMGMPFKTPELYNFTQILEVKTGNMEEIIIPPTYYKILNNAFKNVSKYVKKIIILYPYTKFEIDALKGLDKLIELDLSETKLTSLENINLSFCTCLDTIRIPDCFNLISIKNIFEEIPSLKKIYYKGNILFVKSFKEQIKKLNADKIIKEDRIIKEEPKTDLTKLVFSEKSKIPRRINDNTVKFIDLSKCSNFALSSSVFKGCPLVEEVILPISCSSINSFAFDEIKNLKKVIFSPNKDYYIRDYAFYRCNSLKIIECNVTSVWENAFFECDNLEVVKFEIRTKKCKIESHAFSNCKNLREIYAPNLKKIKQDIIYGSNNLKKIVVHRKCRITKKLFNTKNKLHVLKEGDVKIVTID